MMHPGIAVMVMMLGYIGSLGYNRSRHSQPGRVVIFVPLGDSPDDGNRKNTDHQQKDNGKHN